MQTYQIETFKLKHKNKNIVSHLCFNLSARVSVSYYHDGVDGALVRLLARRGIEEPDGLYLCGDGGSPGRLHNLEGVFLLVELGEESQLFDGRDFLGVTSFTLKNYY